MKAALVLPKTGPLFPKSWNDKNIGAPFWGVTEWGFHVCFDDGTPNTNLTINGVKGAVLDEMRTAQINGVPQKYKVRITRDTHWPGSMTIPEAFAKQLSDDVTFLNQDGKQCSLAVDYEGKDGDFIYRLFVEIRKLRPGRGIFWTMEPNQGGWIVNYPKLVALINNDPLIFVVSQTYDFNMNPYGTADGIRVNLWDAGLRRDKVELYYGLHDKPDPSRWSGDLYDWNNFIA